MFYVMNNCGIFRPGEHYTSVLDSILKSIDITLPTKVHLVKAMIFPVVMYDFPSGHNIQKTKIMAFGPIISWQIRGETMETVTDFILGADSLPAEPQGKPKKNG